MCGLYAGDNCHPEDLVRFVTIFMRRREMKAYLQDLQNGPCPSGPEAGHARDAAVALSHWHLSELLQMRREQVHWRGRRSRERSTGREGDVRCVKMC